MVVGDGVIGNTKSFGDLVFCSSQNPRARDEKCGPIGYVGSAPLVEPVKPGLVSQLTVPAPCRLCHGPTWMEDELGAVHPCCALNGRECLACRASEALNREHRRREHRKVAWKEVKGEGLDG